MFLTLEALILEDLMLADLTLKKCPIEAISKKSQNGLKEIKTRLSPKWSSASKQTIILKASFIFCESFTQF